MHRRNLDDDHNDGNDIHWETVGARSEARNPPDMERNLSRHYVAITSAWINLSLNVLYYLAWLSDCIRVKCIIDK